MWRLVLPFNDPISFECQTRKKVIGLDDLLTDFYKEKSKLIEKENKRAKACKNYNSDEDDDGKEAALSNLLHGCQDEA